MNDCTFWTFFFLYVLGVGLVSVFRIPFWRLSAQNSSKNLGRQLQAWFGIVALSRGLLLSLPSVVASNSPNVQLVLLHSVMLLSLASRSF